MQAQKNREMQAIGSWDLRSNEAKGNKSLKNYHKSFKKPSKINEKTYQESIENRSKINQQSIKNEWKSRSGGCQIEGLRVPNRGLEGFWAAFRAAGHSLNHPEGNGYRLGGVLGPSVLGAREVLGTSWKHLRPSYNVLMFLMEAKWGIPSCMPFVCSISNWLCFPNSSTNHWILLDS